MTNEEIKETERVIGKPFEEIDELSIPSYIRKRDFIEEQKLAEISEEEYRDLGERLGIK